jgi:hypothetical protein
MKGLQISVVGDTYTVSEFDGALDALQAAVGGYIEAFPTRQGVTVFINEEGKLQELPVNRLAMDIVSTWDEYRVLEQDYIAGNAVILGGTDRHGNTLNLSQRERTYVLNVVEAWGLQLPS